MTEREVRAPRRRRGDFVRATSSVLSSIGADGTLSPATATRFCEIAVQTCGAWRAALYTVHDPSGAATVQQLACYERTPFPSAPPLAAQINLEVLRSLSGDETVHERGDLLIAPMLNGPDDEEPARAEPASTDYLVVQALPAVSAAANGRVFSEVDCQRVHVLVTLVALKVESAREALNGNVLGRVNSALTKESTVEGKLNQLAAFIAEAAQADLAGVWLKAHAQSPVMRLRARYPRQHEPHTTAIRPAAEALMQRDLERMSQLEQPTAVVTSALPWLSEILGSEDAELGSQAIVTPIRRGGDAVGVAICSTAVQPAQRAPGDARTERQSLLRALADQIALTAEYMRTSTDAQLNARRFALLAAICEISLAKIGMDEMIDAILARIQEHFDAASVTLALLGSEGSGLRTRSLHRQEESSGGQRQEIKAPVAHQGKTVGTLRLLRYGEKPFRDDEHETLSQAVEQLGLALATSDRYQIQASLAVLDTLTDLPNRRSADSTLEREFERAARQSSRLSIGLLDIDSFKLINDKHGHQAGDEVLRQVARMLKAQLRATDYVARYGGEEFLIVLPGTDSPTARRVCERLRHAVSLVDCRDARGQTITVTASLGGASYPEQGQSSQTVLQAADAALYQAKAEGRNRLCWAALAPAAAT